MQPNFPSTFRPNQPNPFGRALLSDIIQKGQVGYQDTVGIHIYSELRLVDNLRAPETDEMALRCLQTINDYVHSGVLAAQPFNVTLLEVQGPVLHFYKEGPLDKTTVKSAIQFVHIFTSTLYETLKKDLGDKWHGFASCIDHGRSIILRHGTASNSSTVSLGPCANRPAKQLLHGKTPAGALDLPAEWAAHLGLKQPPGTWLTLPLRNQEWISFVTQFENQQLREQFQSLIQAYHQGTTRTVFDRLMNASYGQLHNPEGFTVDRPYRVQAFCNRADLDGFTKIVQAAFENGDNAVDQVASGFAKILEFSEHMQITTPGSIRLPFAGDCGTLLVSPGIENGLSNLRSFEWLKAAIRWKNFDQDTDEGRQKRWVDVFKLVGWAMGSACGEKSLCLLAPIQADNRRFLVAVGWPVERSLDAQELGKGDDIVVHQNDFGCLPVSVQKLFSKIVNTDFWKNSGLTLEKLQQAQIDGAQSNNPKTSDYVHAAVAIQIPRPRPFYK